MTPCSEAHPCPESLVITGRSTDGRLRGTSWTCPCRAFALHDCLMIEIEVPVSRIAWNKLPAPVRGGIENRLGTGVRSGSTQLGAFNCGMASRSPLADGRTAFAKAIPTGDSFADRYRIKRDIVSQLPAGIPTPAVWFTQAVDGWRVLVFDDLTDRHPHFEQPAELAAVLAVVGDLSRILIPSPLPQVPTLAVEVAVARSAMAGGYDHGA